jgi:hypothetical protein
MKNETKKSKTKGQVTDKSAKIGLNLTANEKVQHISNEFEKRRQLSTRKFSNLSGCNSDEWTFNLLNDTTSPVWDRDNSREEKIDRALGVAAALAEIRPQDPVEGMLASQMITIHTASMMSFARASRPGVSPELYDLHMKHAGRLSKTFSALVEALNRHRGKGEQRIVIERVTVNGGQAVVGAVDTGGRGQKKLEEKAHEQVTHAPVAALRSQEPAWDPLPITRDEKRPLPTSRRKKHWGPER